MKAIRKVLLFSFIFITVMGLSSCDLIKKNDPSDAMPTEKGDVVKEYASWSDIDLSQTITVKGYLIGDAPTGFNDVLEEINKKMLKDINTKLEIQHLSWVDYKTKYPLILAAGEDVDFLFTADWCMYAQEASKNAFKEITEEDIKKYMPRHYANCNSAAYNQAKINGKMYMITTSTPDKRVTCLLYRKDLAKKYDVATPKRLGDFTPYFEAIQKNEQEILPMYMSASYDALWTYLANEYDYEINVSNALCCYTEDNNANIAPIYEEPYVASFRYAFRIMKEWYDAGYVNKDVFPNEIASREALVEGKSAIALGNSVDIQSVLAACEEKGYEIGILPLLDAHGKTAAIPYINNGVAIAATSEHPDRTMMALDLIMEEKEYNYLAYFGIEGKNYIITEAGEIGLPKGVTNDTNTYPVDVAGFWFTNKDQFAPLASWSDEYIDLRKKIPNMLSKNPYIEYSPNLSDIQTEVENITLVNQQYLQPMSYGMIGDVDEGIEILKEKLISAGIERVSSEVKKQINHYLYKSKK